jgi:hypothetical protein
MPMDDAAAARRASIAMVHPSDCDPEQWVVCPADAAPGGQVEHFSGADALPKALAYAHREYGSVRWTMR